MDLITRVDKIVDRVLIKVKQEIKWDLKSEFDVYENKQGYILVDYLGIAWMTFEKSQNNDFIVFLINPLEIEKKSENREQFASLVRIIAYMIEACHAESKKILIEMDYVTD